MTRGRLGVVVVLVLLAVLAIGAAIKPTSIYGYRVIDDYTVALQVLGAHPAWRGLIKQTETSTDVAVEVREISIQFGPGTGDERIGYVIVSLDGPLEGRRMVNASTGYEIPRLAPDT